MASATLRDLFAKRDQAHDAFTYVAAVYRQAAETGEIPEDFESTYTEARSAVETLDQRIIELEADETRQAQIEEARLRAGINDVENVHVKNEARTYGEGSENSYYADLARAAHPGSHLHQAAVERLSKHAAEVAGEMRDPNSREGRRAVKSIFEQYRGMDERQLRAEVDRARTFTADETRALNTGTSSGGSFVTPQYFVDSYAPYRQFGRAFADATNKNGLPDYGMTIYLPQVTQAASVFGYSNSASQGTTVAEQDPTAGYESVGLTTLSGEVVISQQLLDRAGPNFQYDKMVFDQLSRAYALSLDIYVLQTAIGTASVNAASAVATTSGAYTLPANIAYAVGAGIAGAKSNIAGTAGTVLRATHIFAPVAPWEWLVSAVDANGRPLFNPRNSGPWAAQAAGEGTPVIEGDTGYTWQGLPVFEDNNIPNVGSNYQFIVADMSEVWLWEGDLVNRTIPQTYAQNLQVLIQSYTYAGVIPRYPTAVQSVNGTATATSVYTF